VTERLLFALLIIAGIVLGGFVVRQIGAWRDARVMREQSIDVSPASIPRLITFSGPWCAECRTQKRIIDGVVADWNREVEVAYVDVIAEIDLARRFDVLTVPTTVVAASDGRIASINRGLVDGDRLRAQLATV
jgi:thioredoxin-like negative regulator of GroEL